MSTTTLADVRSAFVGLVTTMRVHEITRTNRHDPIILTADDLILTEAQAVYGRPFTIAYRHPVSGGTYSLSCGSGNLGMTRREAYLSLTAMRAGIWLTSDAK